MGRVSENYGELPVIWVSAIVEIGTWWYLRAEGIDRDMNHWKLPLS